MSRRYKTSPGPYLEEVRFERERVPDIRQYPYCLPAVRNLSTLPFHPKVTFLVGENGTGKSTLLEALAVDCGLNPEGGSPNFNFSTRASHSPLHKYLRVARFGSRPRDSYFLRAESFFNLATEIERLDQGPGGGPLIDGYGGVSLHEQSHGESFFALFQHRFREHGLYLLDEPEAALSPRRQLQFISLLHDYVSGGAQFIIATHSPIIMAYPDAWIYRLDESGANKVEYAETDHFLITKGFLANPWRSLSVLMEREPKVEEEKKKAEEPSLFDGNHGPE